MTNSLCGYQTKRWKFDPSLLKTNASKSLLSTRDRGRNTLLTLRYKYRLICISSIVSTKRPEDIDI